MVVVRAHPDQAVPGAAAGRARTVSPVAFALLASVQIALIAAITVVSVALPALRAELDLTTSETTTVSLAYGLSFAGLLLLGGRLVDLIGHRTAFLLGVLGFAATGLATAFAPGLVTLLLARFAQGAAAALAAPAAMALLTAVFPDPRRRRRATAVWGGLASVGATAGNVGSGLLLTWLSWRWAFALPALALVAVAAATPRFLPAGRPATPARLDLPGALAATAGLTLLSYGLLRTADQPLTAPGTALPIVAGLAALTGFVLVELRAATPLVPPAFFRPARRNVALVAILVAAGAMATTFLILSLHLQQVRAVSPLWTSLVFLPFGVAQLATGTVTARLVHRFGTGPVTAVGLLTAAAGTLLLGLAVHADGPVWTVVPGLLPLGFGVAATFAGAVVSAVDGVPDQQAGLAAGVANTMMETGPTLGTAAFLALGAAVHAHSLSDQGEPAATAAGHAASFTAMAGTLLAAGLLTALHTLRTPRTGEAA